MIHRVAIRDNKRSAVKYIANLNNFKNGTELRNQSRCHETPIFGTSKDGDTMLSYRSITEAALSTGISKGHIGECIKGIRKSAGGYYWKYQNI